MPVNVKQTARTERLDRVPRVIFFFELRTSGRIAEIETIEWNIRDGVISTGCFKAELVITET